MAASAEEFVALAVDAPHTAFKKYKYTPDPLGYQDVEVKVTHCAVCHSDIHMQNNDWNCTHYPLVAGHEVVGIVEKVGEHVTHLQRGDRVTMFWIRDSCRQCKPCIRGEENVCVKGYTGLILGTNKGGFQDRMRVPADFAIKLPDGVDPVDAAPLLCAGLTVYQPLRMYLNTPGMKVGIIGIGGLGHLALQFASAMGGTVTAFSTSVGKEAEARKFGAHKFVVYNPGAAPGAGYGVPAEYKVDLLLNCAPAMPPEGDFRNMMSLLENNGTLVLLGIPPDGLGKVSLLDVIFGQKRLVGSIVGGRLVLKEMLEFCVDHKIKPQCTVMKFSQLNEALKIVEQNKARYKIVLEYDT